jgi:hypothetical protein
MPLTAETGFMEFTGWCSFQFEKKTSAAKWQSKSYRIDTTFGPL